MPVPGRLIALCGLNPIARLALVLALSPLVFVPVQSQAPRPTVSVTLGADGRLVYSADARGNRVIDFSYAGYGGGGVRLPDVPARIVVPAAGGRDGERIRAAIGLVSAMPLDANGIRGAVVLEKGTYQIDGDIHLAASGVVLRGTGDGEDGTVLVAAGTSRRPLILVAGRGERQEVTGSRIPLAGAYVPAGARAFDVERASMLQEGDRIIVRRPSTSAWISLLGMNTFPGWRPETRLHWQAGSRDVEWDRVVTGVNGTRVSIDAPLTTALDSEYGYGVVSRYEFAGRISRVGVEGLRLVSAFDESRLADEDHAWYGISLDKVENAWVRRITALHFVGSAINVGADAKWLTIEDVAALQPVSEIGGCRRRAFVTAGQLTLFRRCRSEHGLHDFVTGFTAAGPNVFLESSASDALDYSGPLDSWASGVLYDNVRIRGNAIRLINRGTADQGAGWAAANCVLWNDEATDVEVHSPPGAVNQAYGCKGVVTGDGIVYDPRTMPYRDFYRGTAVAPRSLYLAQLGERLGPAAVAAIEPRAIPEEPAGARRLTDADLPTPPAVPPVKPLRVENGRFTIDGEPAWTARTSYSWFQAQMPPGLARTFGPALTRFAPGMTGPGLTDDLEQVAAGMKPRSVFYQHFGLWYDRRRVDHNYYGSPEQRTGDVWAPFMELPWARSGQGKAWDGLSKYDLTRFNPWFFEREKRFADICDRRGLVLYHAFYFQHWLLESRAHYVDFPWRPVNTIQDTGLPDEVPAANVFYDVSNPVRRQLHRLYIRHALDVLGDNVNVVHGIDREYSGPLEFVRFWLDTIAEWQREHGKRLFIALEIPKDEMDAILADPVRGPMVTAVDFHFWLYRADGRLFAIRGGLNRAPREQRPDIATAEELDALKQKLGPAALDQKDFLNGPEFQKLFDALWAGSTPMKYRAWREYRDRYPNLVILSDGDAYPAVTTAVERLIPAAARAAALETDLVRTHRDTAWCVSRPGETYVVYDVSGDAVQLDLSADRTTFSVAWVDSGRGKLIEPPTRVTGGRAVTLTPPDSLSGRPTVALLSKGSGLASVNSAHLTPPGEKRQGVGDSARFAKSAEARPDPPGRVVTWIFDNLRAIGGWPVTVAGTPRVVETPVGRAVEFNGATDGMFLDVNPLEGLAQFTVEALFEPAPDGPPEQRFLHLSEAGSENRLMMETRIVPDRAWSLDTFLRHGDASLTLLDRANTHPSGTWHTAALVFDGKTMTHYVDGVRELSGEVAFKVLGPGRTSIGVRQNLVSWFKGRIREIRVTPQALPPARLLRRGRG
jgi:hypothetical protein